MYYSTGELAQECNYKNNRKNGVSKNYNWNGVLEGETYFKDDEDPIKREMISLPVNKSVNRISVSEVLLDMEVAQEELDVLMAEYEVKLTALEG